MIRLAGSLSWSFLLILCTCCPRYVRTTCEHHSLASPHYIPQRCNSMFVHRWPPPGPNLPFRRFGDYCEGHFRLATHSMSAPALASAPPPLHIIRLHTSAISALFISGDNERIYSGDISGFVVITSTRSLRPAASWKAHTDGLLGIEEWGKQVITSVCDSPLYCSNVPRNPDAIAPSRVIHWLSSAQKATVVTTSYTYGTFPRRPHPPSVDPHWLLTR
jgi:hypothetical protein